MSFDPVGDRKPPRGDSERPEDADPGRMMTSFFSLKAGFDLRPSDLMLLVGESVFLADDECVPVDWRWSFDVVCDSFSIGGMMDLVDGARSLPMLLQVCANSASGLFLASSCNTRQLGQ